MARTLTLLRICGAAVLLAGCAAGAGASAPTWIPQPSFSGEGGQPNASAAVPVPSQPTPSGSGAPASPGSAGATSPGAANDPAVVATKLTAPDAIAVLPDNSALVGERTTGRIVRVQPEPDQPVPTVRTLTGLDTSGGGGLLDLALSPNYAQDNLVFAYLSTPSDNRVVDFTLTGPVTAVLTGIPHGPADNAGHIAFGPDGMLYIATGDAGQPALAASPTSLAGKVLRITDVGQAAPDNPSSASAVFTSGFRSPAALCSANDSNATMLSVEAPQAGDADANAINLLVPGADYGWPTHRPTSQTPIAALPKTQGDAGGCAVIGTTLYATSRQAQLLLSAPLTVSGSTIKVGAFSPALVHTYGRLNTVVAADDGALWLTTTNKDGHGHPIATDERVLRIVPAGGAANFPG